MSNIYLHPLPLRVWHWINASIVFVLIVTGIQLRIPDIHIFESYSIVVLIHKCFGFALAGSFLFWLFYYIFTGGFKKHYRFNLNDIRNMPQQALYYSFSIFKGGKNPFQPTPENKFNALQKIAYLSVMFLCVPVITITGILFSDILYFFSWIRAIGGVRILDTIHVAAAYVFVFYLLVHLYMATLGPKVHSHIKGMITGYEE
ncbi:MAG: cytochrome b/b6 domain-containing protein [Proteobacteria bacterium]|nr:cytochrome b/b6 domain-containing protein [Pseudomonadota bacterium]